jgi:S-adenosyl-L-methionine hydrolase (adenosine-forming)
MKDSPVITLTTDFGYQDPFAGVMKGVICGINPRAVTLDLTHGITPHNIAEAAFVIGTNYRYFPRGSIHVAVVDPGVGSTRRPLIAAADHHFFIGPDNGIFSYVFGMKGDTLRVFHVTAEHYFLSSHSPTFQGRDVFASVAAWFSKGLDIAKFGEPVTDYRMIPLPFPKVSPDGVVQGEVIVIDRFGNAITNIAEADVARAREAGPRMPLAVTVREKGASFSRYYDEAEEGKLCALINSSGYLEFFVVRGSAASRYGISPGDKVTLSSAGIS